MAVALGLVYNVFVGVTVQNCVSSLTSPPDHMPLPFTVLLCSLSMSLVTVNLPDSYSLPA